jgi:hypothetical protein
VPGSMRAMGSAVTTPESFSMLFLSPALSRLLGGAGRRFFFPAEACLPTNPGPVRVFCSGPSDGPGPGPWDRGFARHPGWTIPFFAYHPLGRA